MKEKTGGVWAEKKNAECSVIEAIFGDAFPNVGRNFDWEKLIKKDLILMQKIRNFCL